MIVRKNFTKPLCCIWGHTKEDIHNNVSNFQFVIPFKSHNTPPNVKKLLALRYTKVTHNTVCVSYKKCCSVGNNK